MPSPDWGRASTHSPATGARSRTRGSSIASRACCATARSARPAACSRTPGAAALLVIATTSSGRRFGVLASYLMHGRDGADPERVAWTLGRNLGTDDPDLAAALMQATANGNVRVEVPVYHLTISFDPTDAVSPERMQQVADRVLAELGLSEHQTLMVAHGDRAHPHVHCMVNRVHPETERAWERWQDRPQIERTLRELERELGLREVPGRLYQLEGQTPPERARLTAGERRQAERTGELAFPDRVRAHLDDLRAARSWEAVEAVLEQHGLHFARKGQGLVITDGDHQVKASRVARELSLGRLEERLGAPFPGHEREPTGPEQESPSRMVEEARAWVREYERVDALHREEGRARDELARECVRRDQLTRDLERLDAIDRRLAQAFARVYRDPEAARAHAGATAKAVNGERVAELLRTEPERFGPLCTVEQRRGWGFLIVDDDTTARTAARGAATEWHERTATERRAAALVRESLGDGPQTTLAQVAERAQRLLAERIRARGAHLRQLEETVRAAPRLDVLRPVIRGMLDGLEPHELRHVRMLFTAPQAAILFQARETVKEMVLGRGLER